MVFTRVDSGFSVPWICCMDISVKCVVRPPLHTMHKSLTSTVYSRCKRASDHSIDYRPWMIDKGIDKSIQTVASIRISG